MHKNINSEAPLYWHSCWCCLRCGGGGVGGVGGLNNFAKILLRKRLFMLHSAVGACSFLFRALTCIVLLVFWWLEIATNNKKKQKKQQIF